MSNDLNEVAKAAILDEASRTEIVNKMRENRIANNAAEEDDEEDEEAPALSWREMKDGRFRARCGHILPVEPHVASAILTIANEFDIDPEDLVTFIVHSPI